jgi:imidazolonepropionase-like amidohydrolase
VTIANADAVGSPDAGVPTPRGLRRGVVALRYVLRRRSAVVSMWIAAIVFAAVPAGAQTIAIVGGKVYPVSGPPIDNGTVIIVNGKITAVGAAIAAPAGATVIDANGRWVTPGLVDAATPLGVNEIDAVADTADNRAKGDRDVAAAFRVWEGLNPDSVLWTPARGDGVTDVVVLPTGGLVAGQAALVVTLEAATAREMVRRAPVAMVANLGAPAAAETSARGEMLMRMRELLEDARVYGARKLAFEGGNTRNYVVGRLHLDAMGLVLGGKLPLMVAADRASDIENALALAEEYKLRLIILGGAEGWKVASRLAAAKVPVITTALDNIPASFATLGVRQENAARLRQAGVSVAIKGGGVGSSEAFMVRNIRQQAGNAVAYGLSWDDALRAVTLTPAELFGAEGSIGSLQAGRDGNVVVWDGDPFEFSTRAMHVFVRGRESTAPSRQDMLTERYKPKP